MRKRYRIALAILLVAVAGVIGWQIFRFHEPVYHGKRLTGWLEQYGTNHWSAGRNGELDKQAEAAIRQIGTNAIPLYLEMIATKQSPFSFKLSALVPAKWFAQLHSHSMYESQLLGAYGLIALGAQAKASIPAVVGRLVDKDPLVRDMAAFTLRYLGPVAGDAVPSLITCLADSSVGVQGEAIMGLGEIRQHPEQTVPVLVEVLEQPTSPLHPVILRANAIWALGQFGARADAAVPKLVESLSDTQWLIRSAATNALRKIDPEAAARAGVK